MRVLLKDKIHKNRILTEQLQLSSVKQIIQLQPGMDIFEKNLEQQGKQVFYESKMSADTSERIFDLVLDVSSNIDELSPPETIELVRSGERYFNQIEINKDFVRKKINNLEKGVREIQFYQKAPCEISRFLPRLINFQINKESAQYDLEFIPHLDCATLYVYGQLNPDKFHKLLQKLTELRKGIPRKNLSSGDFAEAVEHFILKKMYERQQMITSINSNFWDSIKDLYLAVTRSIRAEIQTNKSRELVVSNGDLCFSNILWDQQERIWLIDPKGNDEVFGLFLPEIYDVAKLSQCVHGNYDGILRDKCTSFYEQKHSFDQWTKDIFGLDPKMVALFESSMFLSLLPLHKNNESLWQNFSTAALAAWQRHRGS